MDDMLKTYMPVSLTEWRRRNAVLVADSVFLSEESEVMDDDLRVEVGGGGVLSVCRWQVKAAGGVGNGGGGGRDAVRSDIAETRCCLG